jgi:hypothetical protein
MSTHSPKILKGIRAAFIGFRWLFVLSLIGIVYQFVAGPASITATVGLAPESTSLAQNVSAPADRLHIDGLKAEVTVPVGPNADAELKSLSRSATLPWMLVAAAAGLALCELAQRLAENLATGELFSERNRKLLKIFSFVLVGATVVARLLAEWGNHAFGKYAASHLTVAGGRVLATADHVGIAELRLNLGNPDLLIALLLLVVVWAFSEGAALRRDSDLTI